MRDFYPDRHSASAVTMVPSSWPSPAPNSMIVCSRLPGYSDALDHVSPRVGLQISDAEVLGCARADC